MLFELNVTRGKIAKVGNYQEKQTIPLQSQNTKYRLFVKVNSRKNFCVTQ